MEEPTSARLAQYQWMFPQHAPFFHSLLDSNKLSNLVRTPDKYVNSGLKLYLKGLITGGCTNYGGHQGVYILGAYILGGTIQGFTVIFI